MVIPKYMMQPTLVIISGLPGTGKSILSNRLAREMRWPLLRIDDVAGDVPPEADFRFWDEKILVLLTLVEAQLELGVSVIADSVFMGKDRVHAQEIAFKHKALFCPIYCFVSDEKLWERRVTERYEELGNTDVATWERIQHQRQWFTPWQENTALFVDAVDPAEQNYEKVYRFVKDASYVCQRLEVNVPLVKGQYHK
jgi:predicted kinase